MWASGCFGFCSGREIGVGGGKNYLSPEWRRRGTHQRGKQGASMEGSMGGEGKDGGWRAENSHSHPN